MSRFSLPVFAVGWRAACARHRVSIAMGIGGISGGCASTIALASGFPILACEGAALGAGMAVSVLVHFAFPVAQRGVS